MTGFIQPDEHILNDFPGEINIAKVFSGIDGKNEIVFVKEGIKRTLMAGNQALNQFLVII